MSLYPSLEDMQVHKMVLAQQNAFYNQMNAQQSLIYEQQPPLYEQTTYPQLGTTTVVASNNKPFSAGAQLYPGLTNFMGLELSSEMISLNMPEYMQNIENSVMPTTTGSLVAPLSSQTVGLQRAHVTNGIREVIVCKGSDKKIGLRVQDINNGIFITLVCKDSPAALVGLRFGDQILQINYTNLAGYSKEKVHNILKQLPENNINMVIRDRPFERTVTMHKDSNGRIGFEFNKGKIVSIVKDSSAARNGLLLEHHLLEVNGQNVVGMRDKDITAIILNDKEPVITVTIIPSFIYDHMMKKMPISILRNVMNHSIPEI